MDAIVTIDAAGRLVIPIELRRQLGIEGGSRLRLRVEGDHIAVAVEGEAPAVREIDGLLVATGVLAGEGIDHRDIRDARLRKLAGLR